MGFLWAFVSFQLDSASGEIGLWWGEGEQAGFGFGEDVAVNQAFQLAAVAGRQRLQWLDAVLSGQFQHRLAGDVQAFQRAFGSGELFGEEPDLEMHHQGFCTSGVRGAGRAGRARSELWSG